MAKLKFKKFDAEKKMRFRDEPEEMESGMYLSLLADEPGEVEADGLEFTVRRPG